MLIKTDCRRVIGMWSSELIALKQCHKGESPLSSPNKGTEQHGSKVSSQIPQGRLCFCKTDQLCQVLLFWIFCSFGVPPQTYNAVLASSFQQEQQALFAFNFQFGVFKFFFFLKGHWGEGQGIKQYLIVLNKIMNKYMSNWCL